MLPHWDRNCRWNFLSHPVTAYWHRANQSQRWSCNAGHLAIFLSFTQPGKPNPGNGTPGLPLSRRTPVTAGPLRRSRHVAGTCSKQRDVQHLCYLCYLCPVDAHGPHVPDPRLAGAGAQRHQARARRPVPLPVHLPHLSPHTARLERSVVRLSVNVVENDCDDEEEEEDNNNNDGDDDNNDNG